MKKIIAPLLVCISINVFSNSGKPVYSIRISPPDTTVLPRILALPLNSYIGKPVDSLLSVLPLGFTHRGFMPVRVSYNIGISQSYGDWGTNTVLVQIYIDNYQHTLFPNRARTSTWNMNLVKQEIISFIKVIKNNNVCLYGCNNPNYDY